MLWELRQEFVELAAQDAHGAQWLLECLCPALLLLYSFFGRHFRIRQDRDNTFCGGGCESLGHGLLAATSTPAASTSTTTAASPLTFSASGGRTRRCSASCGLFANRLRFDVRVVQDGLF